MAKEGEPTKAAGKLHVSQSTISAQIQALEGVFGEKLFPRAGPNVALTEVGQQALIYAEEIFSIGQDLLNSVKQLIFGDNLHHLHLHDLLGSDGSILPNGGGLRYGNLRMVRRSISGNRRENIQIRKTRAVSMASEHRATAN